MAGQDGDPITVRNFQLTLANSFWFAVGTLMQQGMLCCQALYVPPENMRVGLCACFCFVYSASHCRDSGKSLSIVCSVVEWNESVLIRDLLISIRSLLLLQYEWATQNLKIWFASWFKPLPNDIMHVYYWLQSFCSIKKCVPHCLQCHAWKAMRRQFWKLALLCAEFTKMKLSHSKRN